MKQSSPLQFIRLGIDLVSPIVLGVFIGHLIDNHFNTKPLALIIFIVLGILAGLLNIFRILKKIV